MAKVDGIPPAPQSNPPNERETEVSSNVCLQGLPIEMRRKPESQVDKETKEEELTRVDVGCWRDLQVSKFASQSGYRTDPVLPTAVPCGQPKEV